jgi:hypothetical protein
VVDVSVGQKDHADFLRIEPERFPVQFVGIMALMHPAVHQELQPVIGEMIARSRDFSRRTEECDLHEEASQSFVAVSEK